MCTHLIRKFNQEYGRNVNDISQDAIQVLTDYHWPGNIRELENVIGRAMINMKIGEKLIKVYHLPALLTENKLIACAKSSMGKKSDTISLKNFLEENEENYIRELLNKNGGNKTKTAKALEISIRSLYYKLEKYQIE